MKLSVREDVFPIAGAFTISRGTRTESRVVTVTVTDGEVTGRAECYPYARYDETVDSVMAQINAMAPALAECGDIAVPILTSPRSGLEAAVRVARERSAAP